MERFKDRGLLPESFGLSSVLNGIALCPLCHINFDAYHDPGLVIVPSDLEFFEVENYIKREELAQLNLVQPEGESGPLPQLIHPLRLEILVGTRSLVSQEILKGQRVGLSGTVEILIRFGPLPGANIIHPVNTPVKNIARGSLRPIVE
jgi:hypothetical protein